MMLNHRISQDAPRTFEALTRYSFPSKPQSSLASVLLDEMVLLSAGEPEEGFILGVCQIILAQWSRCVEETYVSDHNEQGFLFSCRFTFYLS
jgi:hypothetical protein